MADTNYTSPPTTTERPAPGGFIPLEPASQHSTYPHDTTLYLKTNAPADALYDAADYRLKSVIELLRALHQGDPEQNPFCSLSRSLLLLISDAQSLYQADHQQRHRRR